MGDELLLDQRTWNISSISVSPIYVQKAITLFSFLLASSINCWRFSFFSCFIKFWVCLNFANVLFLGFYFCSISLTHSLIYVMDKLRSLKKTQNINKANAQWKRCRKEKNRKLIKLLINLVDSNKMCMKHFSYLQLKAKHLSTSICRLFYSLQLFKGYYNWPYNLVSRYITSAYKASCRSIYSIKESTSVS